MKRNVICSYYKSLEKTRARDLRAAERREREILHKNRALARSALSIYPVHNEVRTTEVAVGLSKDLNRTLNRALPLTKDKTIRAAACAIGVITGCVRQVYLWHTDAMSATNPRFWLSFFLCIAIVTIPCSIIFEALRKYAKRKVYETEASLLLIKYLNGRGNSQDFTFEFHDCRFYGLLPAFFYEGDDPEMKVIRAVAHMMAEAIARASVDEAADFDETAYQSLVVECSARSDVLSKSDQSAASV